MSEDDDLLAERPAPDRPMSMAAKERAQLAGASNRRAREVFEQRLAEMRGPGACRFCGAQPCGHLWTRPGHPEPGGERCCAQCTHEPVEGWAHTHTAWAGGRAHPVCALTMREGETVFLRRDGVAQFLELRRARAPKDGEETPGEEGPVPIFLGRAADRPALFPREDGGAETSSWVEREDADELWLVSRRVAAEGALAEAREKTVTAFEAAAEERSRRNFAEEAMAKARAKEEAAARAAQEAVEREIAERLAAERAKEKEHAGTRNDSESQAGEDAEKPKKPPLSPRAKAAAARARRARADRKSRERLQYALRRGAGRG